MESLWGHAPFYLGVPGAEPAWPAHLEAAKQDRGKKDAPVPERP